jgi:hypothetical protein
MNGKHLFKERIVEEHDLDELSRSLIMVSTRMV